MPAKGSYKSSKWAELLSSVLLYVIFLKYFPVENEWLL